MTFFKLFIASLKIMFRDWLTLFWGLAFPAIFIAIFGLFSFGQRTGSANLAIIDRADTEFSRQIVSGLRQVKFFKINDKITDETEARKAIQDGRLNAAIIIPEAFQTDSFPSQLAFTVFYDKSNLVEYELVRGVLNQFISEANLRAVNAPQLFTLREEALDARRIKYMDFLLPGVMGMGLMMNSIIGIAVDMTRYREQRTLKRIRATPLSPRLFLISQVLAYLVLVFLQATLIILIATVFFGATVHGSLLTLYFLTLVSTLIFLNIGFIVAGVSRSASAASGLSQVISMPMLFLSGTFFPTSGLPAIVQALVQALPLTPVMKAMRAIALYDASLLALSSELLQIGLWLVVTFAIATRTFRFQTD